MKLRLALLAFCVAGVTAFAGGPIGRIVRPFTNSVVTWTNDTGHTLMMAGSIVSLDVTAADTCSVYQVISYTGVTNDTRVATNLLGRSGSGTFRSYVLPYEGAEVPVKNGDIIRVELQTAANAVLFLNMFTE